MFFPICSLSGAGGGASMTHGITIRIITYLRDERGMNAPV
jgi:hypothetical protein